MKIKLILPGLFVLLPFFMKAQITVTCDGKIGLNNPSPYYTVDIIGSTAIRPASSGSFFQFENGPNGCLLRPSANHYGMIGYYDKPYSVSADYIYGSNILYSSDKNLKKNINTLYDALPVIKKLRPVSFDYNFDYGDVEDLHIKNKLETDDKNRLGFVAQEVQELLPQIVLKNDADSTLCIRMIDFIPLLVKGMQEQMEQIDSLKSVINEMKASDNSLKSTNTTGTDNTLSTQAKLYQNIPNPFSENTLIKCFIPAETGTARLLVFNMQGTLVKTYGIQGRNQAEVTISGAELNPGMYIYSLVLDNREIDSKRMILTE